MHTQWIRFLSAEPWPQGRVMSSHAKHTKANVIPCLRYRDALQAIEWPCMAFGFEEQRVVPGEHGTIGHAQLTFGLR